MNFELFQPWSTFVMKVQLPPEVLLKMIRITDEIVENAENEKSFGDNLIGQIKDELVIDLEILEHESLMGFFLNVIICIDLKSFVSYNAMRLCEKISIQGIPTDLSQKAKLAPLANILNSGAYSKIVPALFEFVVLGYKLLFLDPCL